jgi:hypothetical protein
MSFPDWSNFSNNSSSMILVEALAYLSDVMHYYIDENFKETFLQSAKERKNIIRNYMVFGIILMGFMQKKMQTREMAMAVGVSQNLADSRALRLWNCLLR